jgi:nickel/cobalt exporter
LIDVPEITPAVAFFGLLLAFGLGAMHALSPGHGKAVVGAYLVGSKGTPKHAAFLGLTVTITHTLGVFALGLLTIFAANFILPETIMPFLSFFSGLIVLYIGLTMFKTRLLSALGYRGGEHHHDHGHDHGHTHDDHDQDLTHTHDGHTHSHAVPDSITWKSLLALGVSGGLLPCPSALVLMLSAINLNRIGYGLILTVAFSFGLAATLTIVGLVFLYGGRIFDGEKVSSYRLVKALPVFSAFVIACVGAVICYTSIT